MRNRRSAHADPGEEAEGEQAQQGPVGVSRHVEDQLDDRALVEGPEEQDGREQDDREDEVAPCRQRVCAAVSDRCGVRTEEVDAETGGQRG